MHFELSFLDPVTDDLEEFVACEVASFTQPFQNIYRIWYPVFGNPSEGERQAAFNGLVELHQIWTREDSDCRFLQVKDTQNNDKVVAGVLYKVHTENPFKSDGSAAPDHEPSYHKPGIRRQYVTKALDIFTHAHHELMQKPHVYCFMVFTHPEYRQRGLMDMALGKVCAQADELGLEAWLESVIEVGVPIYRRHGFVPYQELTVQPPADQSIQQTEEWKFTDGQMQPLRFWPMWRPAFGKFTEGETKAPWNT